MRIHLNPASEALRAFAEGLPGSFDRSGETLHEGRNTIKAFEADGNKLAVKRFQRPDPLRAVIYTFFRRSKARRSYEHAERLRALGIDSPGTGRLERIPPPRPAVRQLLRLPPFRLRPALAGHDPVPGSRHASRAGGLRPLRSRAARERNRTRGFQSRQHPLAARPRHGPVPVPAHRHQPDALLCAGIASAPVHDKPATPGLPAAAFLFILDRYAEARGWNGDDTLLRGTFFRLVFGRRRALRKRFRQRISARRNGKTRRKFGFPE